MRICFITTGDIVSLATMKRATGMAQPLINLGHNVAIIAEDTENNRDRFALECPDAEILFFKNSNTFSEVKEKKKLLKMWKADIVYVCSFGFRNWIHRYNAVGKWFVVEHSELVSEIPNNKKKFLYKLVEKLSTKLFNGQVYASRYLEEHFNHKLKNKKPSLYSPYAFSRVLINHESSLFDILKAKYSGKKVVVYMGTLALNYGFLDILKATQMLYVDRQDFIFLVMGAGRHKEQGENFIKLNFMESYTEMLGYVAEEDVPAYFKLADVFVSPLYDTIQDIARCPSKLFMYIPYQKPIVTCKLGEAFHLFKNDGYYFEPNNVESLKYSLGDALDDRLSLPKVNPTLHDWEKRSEDFITWLNHTVKL